MLKADELMIGNLVYNHRLWICPIVEIKKDTAVIIAKHYGEEEFKLSDLNPIPITLEILENIGFLRSDRFSFLAGSRSNFIIPGSSYKLYQLNDLVSYSIGDHSLITVKYIHELQNLMKLCGLNNKFTL